MFKFVVLSCLVACASAQYFGAYPLAYSGAYLAPFDGNYRGPLSLAPGQPANILGADGRPLDTLEVNLDKSAHYTRKAFETAGIHLLKKRSVALAAPLAYSAYPYAAYPTAYVSAYDGNYRGPLSLAPGQPANILGADGRPLDTLEVNLDKSAHYTRKAFETAGIHLLKKRSVAFAAPLAYSAYPYAAYPTAYVSAYDGNYRGPLSLAPGQPANILGADGRPLDTLEVNLDKSAHYTRKAFETAGIHLLKKRSVAFAAPLAYSAYPYAAYPTAYVSAYDGNYRGPLSLAPGQPANILGADGRPLDTLEVNLDKSAHYTRKAFENAGIHLIKKRSAPLAYSAPIVHSAPLAYAAPLTYSTPLAYSSSLAYSTPISYSSTFVRAY